MTGGEVNSDDLRATADDLVTATNPRVVAAKAALYAAAAEVDSLRAENAELRARIETHDEMRLANHAASEMRKARAERDALRAKLAAVADDVERAAEALIHVNYCPNGKNMAVWLCSAVCHGIAREVVRAALASPAPTDPARYKHTDGTPCDGECGAPRHHLPAPHGTTYGPDSWTLTDLPSTNLDATKHAPTDQTSDGPDLGGKLAVDEAQCDCHRGQPSADVYKCRYGGLHRRRASGMWHHPGDQALFPAAAVQPDEAATEAPTDQTSDEASAQAGRSVAAISTMISDSYPQHLDSEAHMWRRHQKVANEAGEVLDAIEGAIGENPRKGVVKTWGDVDKELLDTANAALGAYEFNHGNDGSSIAALFAHIEYVRGRLTAAFEAAADHPDQTRNER